MRRERGFSVLAYHMVEPRFDFGITRVTPNQFRRHVEELARLGRPVVRLDALWKPLPGARFALTFDDAYLSVYEHALPVLSEHQWPATLFVVAGYVGALNTWDVNLGGLVFRHMDWSHLRDLVAVGWQVGSHGQTHRYLNFLSAKELHTELERSKKTLEDRLGVAVTALAPPYGRASRRVRQVAAEVGYREVALLYGWSEPDVRWEDGVAVVSRRGVYLPDTPALLRRKAVACGVERRLFDLAKVVIGLGSRGSILVQLFQNRIWARLRQ